jgi:hypothetical protein
MNRITFIMIAILLSPFAIQIKSQEIRAFCNTPYDTSFQKYLIPGCQVMGDYSLYINGIEDYIPDANSRTLYVRVNFHIMQRQTGNKRNFDENNPNDVDFLENFFERMNTAFSNIEAPKWCDPPDCGLTGDPYITDSKIQFILENIYYHRDDLGWTNNNTLHGYY